MYLEWNFFFRNKFSFFLSFLIPHTILNAFPDVKQQMNKWNRKPLSSSSSGEWKGYLLFSILIVLLSLIALFVSMLRKKRQRRYQREFKARKMVKDSINAEFTTVESGSFEWVNLLLRHQYKCILSQIADEHVKRIACLLYTSPSPRDRG